VIVQKPLATSLEETAALVRLAEKVGLPAFVHENWRWQAPLQAIRKALQEERIGVPIRARIDMLSGFPVFKNQPALKELEQFIIVDLGTHTLDLARSLFGEMTSLFCLTKKVHGDIRGEDVATILMESQSGIHVLVEMAYADTPLERECFPQTLLFIEGSEGSIEIKPDYRVVLTTASGTTEETCAPVDYPWVDPDYAVVQASMVPCLQNLADALSGKSQAETTVRDNYETLRLVFACYESAKKKTAVTLGPTGFGALEHMAPSP
jgi:predicted dehydrogenase